MREIWKDIKGHEGFYQVSNKGKIKSLSFKQSPNIKILKPCLLKIGYYQVVLHGEKLYVHRLVAQHFISNPMNKPEVNHKKGIKTDNRVSELEWVTKSEQLKHSYEYLNRKSNPPKGINHKNAKLNELQVRIIRRLKGELYLREISSIFNININSISKIQNNKAYI